MSKDILFPLRCIHGKMHDTWIECQMVHQVVSKIKMCGSEMILYVFTPTHENLGDHAITVATMDILNQEGFDYLEIPQKELNLLWKYKVLHVMNHHPILVNGGGNIGTLWPKAEQLFRDIIRFNPNSRILCLPNTAFFENSAKGNGELLLSSKIYNAHSSLVICAREAFSLEILQSFFKNTVLIPDMVLSMQKSEGMPLRRGCLLCLRRDREKTRTVEEERKIQNYVEMLFGEDTQKVDTCIGRNIPLERRLEELEAMFEIFRHAELVITDRLHGMIFAAITGTPCIVINSKSHKVRGCYEWIKNLGYIEFLDDVDNIVTTYNRLPKGNREYNNQHLQQYYEQLRKILVCFANSAKEYPPNE